MKEQETPFEMRSCHDCANLKAVVNLWCGSKEAIAWRGTAIPGGRKCPFWKPDWDWIDSKYYTEEHGYVIPKPVVLRVWDWLKVVVFKFGPKVK